MAVGYTKDQEMAAHWKTQIEQCDKATHNWHQRGDKILKNYRDERTDRDLGVAKRLNLFWANTETVKPAIYSKTPLAVVERRFLDKDTTGRFAATILERALRYEVASCGYDKAVRRARTDYLTVGRGQAWVRYNPKFGAPISPPQTADNTIEINGKVADERDVKADEEVQREVLSESLCVDYVHWKAFKTLPASARIWDEVEGVARELYMSRQDLIDNFGDKVGKKIELDHKPKTDANKGGESTLSGQEGMQATVYEIWWKPTKKVYFIAKSYLGICKEVDDPLKLEGFFPCPEPISATMTNDTLIPVPDYVESQDQYQQIDELSKRIDVLTEACKARGLYDASSKELARLFQEGEEPNLIPVDSWAAFADKGGVEKAIAMFPIEDIAKTIQVLIEVRAKIIEDLDRTTGINDIMRGTSDARETMGAQRLKTNNTATRIQERQDEFARFCRDIMSIMGEIISEHYDPKTLIEVSGAMYDEGLDPPDLPMPPSPMMGHNGGPPMDSQPGMSPSMPGAMPPQAAPIPGAMAAPPALPAPAGAPLPPEAVEAMKLQRKEQMLTDAIMLLRNDKLRGFRIDIETDSTVAGDAQAEKAARIEFVEGVTKFIETAGQVIPTAPEFAPLAAKMLQFAVRGFRVGRDLESAIEDFCEKVEQKAKQAAANPQQSPEQIKADAEKMKVQGEIQRQQLENEGEQRNAEIDYQSKQLDFQMKQMEIEIARIQAEADMRKAQAEERKMHLDHERGEREHQRAMELGEHQHKIKMSESSKQANGSAH